MCISVLSTAHPEYPFVLISNRDEFVNRPTARADWWDPPHQYVLGGRDLQRKEKGTWLGITKQGRIAILTNFREEGDFEIDNSKSRGAITNTYLTVPPDSSEKDEEFVQRLMDGVGIHNVGGFTMLFGKLKEPKEANGQISMPGLALVSNRTETPSRLDRIATKPNEVHGVSNSHFGDVSWPKVVHGEQLLRQAINASVTRKDSQETFIEHLFDILCVDALPKRKNEEDWDMFVRHMRNSIMIPPAKGQLTEQNDSDTLRTVDENVQPQTAKVAAGKGAYGTSKQTVILVSREGKVTFVERTLYDGEGKPVSERERDNKVEFYIEGWDGTPKL
ncbi:Hypothetical predicted protein [Lecanosticta acicola]|uniref:DUF833-domain-containing protein n=1 Tax=Lecanosticta acicola TaxID=111012 RepID=A0AAI9EBZ3_9PEZI|nr:Hypothetical predicted protein [Lecanosticta acicola]